MAKGLALPPRALRGKTVLESGADQLRKIVRQTARPGSSMNPFLAVGMESVVFTLGDSTAKGLVESRIRGHFARLERERRAKLRKVSIEPVTPSGDFGVQIEFTDLELQRPESVSTKRGA